MKKLIVVFMFIFALFTNAYAEEEKTSFSFRNGITWGMSFDEVKTREGLDDWYKLSKVGDAEVAEWLAIYNVNVSKYLASLDYIFFDNRLYYAHYIFDRYDEVDCEYLYKAMESKYGEFQNCSPELMLSIMAAIEYGDPNQIGNFSTIEIDKCCYTVLNDGTHIYIYSIRDDKNNLTICYADKDAIMEAVGAYNTDGL